MTEGLEKGNRTSKGERGDRGEGGKSKTEEGKRRRMRGRM